jgi:hypothetical protein
MSRKKSSEKKPASAASVEVTAKPTVQSRLGPCIAPQFKHIRLANTYPIIDIAKLAACLGDGSFEARLQSVIDMLALIEKVAALPEDVQIWEEIRKRDGEEVDTLPPKARKELLKKYRYMQAFFQRCTSILEKCERDKASGLVTRASLIAEVYKDATKGVSTDHGRELFNEWLDSKAVGIAPSDHYVENSSKHTIPDDSTALNLIRGFHQWLKKEKKTEKTPRSRKTGKLVSKKTKGAGRGEKKGYKAIPEVIGGMEEFSARLS